MIVIHVNPRIDNQVLYGEAVARGFKAHGVEHLLTADIHRAGDFHVIIGPWFAYREYHDQDNVLYLDRACWEHPNYSCVNWLSGGHKVWDWSMDGPDRYHPPLEPLRADIRRLLVLCDYGEDGRQKAALARPYYPCVDIRPHPSDLTPSEPLEVVLSRYDLAYGGKSTALVTAACMGLRVISYDKYSPVYPIAGRVANNIPVSRMQWLRALSWHNWTLEEFTTGAAWEHLGKAIRR